MIEFLLAAAGLLFIGLTASLLKDRWGMEYRGKSSWELLIKEERQTDNYRD
ncbi:hypothetical protein J9317_17825 [Metabacillus sp. KIGAM252]|uniref:Uncharacterized protein n=1 Tax=Metabacillus flavus TaxID=2823519 RepID=A0ABS5LIP7_9BACI|nr:hypothetical protein [Metabacillus flavus]MBS2970607.1 hypothetical protein [Metabacillus flavus]